MEEADEDADMTSVWTPVNKGWLFVPWYTSTVAWVRRQFTALSAGPKGLEVRKMSVPVYLREWADESPAGALRSRNADFPARVSLY